MKKASFHVLGYHILEDIIFMLQTSFHVLGIHFDPQALVCFLFQTKNQRAFL